MDDVMVIEATLPVFFIGLSGGIEDNMLVRLSWESDDPYAVTLAVPATGGMVVDWVFARELLWAGLDSPVGEGDVRIIPGEGHDLIDADEVEVRLYDWVDGCRYGRLFFDRVDVLAFLLETRLEYLSAARRFDAAVNEALDSGGAL